MADSDPMTRWFCLLLPYTANLPGVKMWKSGRYPSFRGRALLCADSPEQSAGRWQRAMREKPTPAPEHSNGHPRAPQGEEQALGSDLNHPAPPAAQLAIGIFLITHFNRLWDPFSEPARRARRESEKFKGCGTAGLVPTPDFARQYSTQTNEDGVQATSGSQPRC